MGKFMLGFLVGAAVGAGVALILSTRQHSQEGLVASLQENVHNMLEEARRAATVREEQLWQEFYERIPEAKRPPTA